MAKQYFFKRPGKKGAGLIHSLADTPGMIVGHNDFSGLRLPAHNGQGHMGNGIGQFGCDTAKHERGQGTETVAADDQGGVAAMGLVDDVAGNTELSRLDGDGNTAGWESRHHEFFLGHLHKLIDLNAAGALPSIDSRFVGRGFSC